MEKIIVFKNKEKLEFKNPRVPFYCLLKLNQCTCIVIYNYDIN